MGVRLSFILDDLQIIDHVGKAGGLTGQNLSLIALLRELVRHRELEVLEVLVDIRALADQEFISQLAGALLEPDLMGKGKLEVLPISFIPEIWGDGRERIIFCHDLITLTRDRQLRDRWAKGPSPLFWDTHNQPPGKLQLALTGAKGLTNVPYDRILCLSDYLLKGTDIFFRVMAPSSSGGAPARLDYIPRSLVTSQFASAKTPEEKAEFRRLHGLPEQGRIAVFMSRLTPAAKADLAPLIESFAADASEDEYLVIAGPENSPGYVSALRQLVPDARAKQIIIREHVKPEVRSSFLAACDFFTFPGDFLMEGAGLVIVEALCCGLPVVCSDLDGFREAVQHEVTGLKARTVILPGFERAERMAGVSSFFLDGIQQAQCVWIDHEQFMAAFWRMMREHGFRQACASRAKESVEQKFSLTGYMDRIFAMANESLEMARRDGVGRSRLQEEAAQAGSPALFWEVFRFGGSEEASSSSVVNLTQKGARVRSGELALDWYADVLPFVVRPFQDKVIDRLAAGPAEMAEILRLAEAFSLSNSDCFFQIGLLLKQNCIRLEVSSA